MLTTSGSFDTSNQSEEESVSTLGRTTAVNRASGNAGAWENWFIGADPRIPSATAVPVPALRTASMSTNGYAYTYASIAISSASSADRSSIGTGTSRSMRRPLFSSWRDRRACSRSVIGSRSIVCASGTSGAVVVRRA